MDRAGPDGIPDYVLLCSGMELSLSIAKGILTLCIWEE